MDKILNEELEKVVDGAEENEEIDDSMKDKVDDVIDNFVFIEPTYKVYVKVDEQSRIVAVNSSMWLTEEEIERDGWVQIDEGTEYPKYPHAQSNFFTEPTLYTEDGFYNYKIVNATEGSVYPVIAVQRTEEEIQADRLPLSYSSEISQLKSQLSATDYKAIKFAEGWITEEEYAPIRVERQAIRDRINELEELLSNINE